MTRTALPRIATGILACALAGLAGFAAPAATALASTRVPVLTAISASHHRKFDRIVFTFSGGVPGRRGARYVSQLPGGASAPEVAGRAKLLVTFRGTLGKDARGLPTYGPAARSYALPGVMQV